jgi:hypothetical protein
LNGKKKKTYATMGNNVTVGTHCYATMGTKDIVGILLQQWELRSLMGTLVQQWELRSLLTHNELGSYYHDDDF